MEHFEKSAFGDIGEIRAQFDAAVKKEPWDKWYSTLPDDLRRKLSIHDFKRLGDCFKAAFGIEP